MKRWIWFILGILMVIGLLGGAFAYLSLSKPHYNLMPVQKPEVNDNSVIEERHITYLLAQIGASNLHPPPLSSDNPQIEIFVDGDKFYSEINKGSIATTKREGSGADIRIITTRDEVVNTFRAQNGNEYLKNSVANGKTNIQMVAGYSKLFSKGYLGLYQELTGKSVTGNMIKIFSGG